MNDVERRVEPHLSELDQDVPRSRRYIHRRGITVKAFGGDVQLMAARSDVLGQERRRPDELAIDEHLGARHVGLDAERFQRRRRLRRRDRRFLRRRIGRCFDRRPAGRFTG